MVLNRTNAENGLCTKLCDMKGNGCYDVVPNMVVDFQILNFCLFTCLFVPQVLLILENVPIFIPKTVLKSGL